jgi:hypothetical protein
MGLVVPLNDLATTYIKMDHAQRLPLRLRSSRLLVNF